MIGISFPSGCHRACVLGQADGRPGDELALGLEEREQQLALVARRRRDRWAVRRARARIYGRRCDRARLGDSTAWSG